MEKYTLKKIVTFIFLHQIFIIATMICIYLYEYIILKYPLKNDMYYLVFAFISGIGSFLFLLEGTICEWKLVKKQLKIGWIDRIYLEIVLILAIAVLMFLFQYLQRLNVKVFSIAGLILAVGMVAYFMDTVVIIVYFSMIRRMAQKVFVQYSFIYFLSKLCRRCAKGNIFQEVAKKIEEERKVREALRLIAEGQLDRTLNIDEFHGQEREIAEALNQIQKGLKESVEARIRDEKIKADLITNVSHDIKTPLTSIVNYVELLRREELGNEKAKSYICIIANKAERLKQLTEDLIEVSKISSGNIHLEKQKIDFLELLYQTGGEFNERFEERNLTIVTKLPHQSLMILADGRQLFRAIENLYTNAAKYALEDTKVYVELLVEKEMAVFCIKNVFDKKIENYKDLTERFVRGEESRTTEGSGLGLSITKNLVILMGGYFDIEVKEDLFIAVMKFPLLKEERKFEILG